MCQDLTIVATTLHAFVAAAVQALEDAVRAVVPLYVPPPFRWTTDWRMLADQYALARLHDRGFVDASTLYEPGVGVIVSLRHECGAWCAFRIETNDATDAREFTTLIDDHARCYCVRRNHVRSDGELHEGGPTTAHRFVDGRVASALVERGYARGVGSGPVRYTITDAGRAALGGKEP